MNGSSLFDLPAITDHRLFQRGGGWARRREQRFNKLPRLRSVQLNLLALSNHLAGDFSRMRDDEFGQRAPLNGGGFTEKLLVRRSYPGDESLAFRFLKCRSHAQYVCLYGTQIKL